MLETIIEFVPLILLMGWIVVLFLLLLSKTTTANFTAASGFIALFIVFFSFGKAAITEVSLSGIATIKTNAEGELRQIQEIRDNVKKEGENIHTEIKILRAEIDKVMGELAPRQIASDNSKKVTAALKKYPSQFSYVTYWEIKECKSLSNQIYAILVDSDWTWVPPPEGASLSGITEGVLVYFHPDASDKVKKAANALVQSLNDAGISSELRQSDEPQPYEKVWIIVGTKPS
jgi:hypothetical protein